MSVRGAESLDTAAGSESRVSSESSAAGIAHLLTPIDCRVAIGVGGGISPAEEAAEADVPIDGMTRGLTLEVCLRMSERGVP